jgi:hypothetical protein
MRHYSGGSFLVTFDTLCNILAEKYIVISQDTLWLIPFDMPKTNHHLVQLKLGHRLQKRFE